MRLDVFLLILALLLAGILAVQITAAGPIRNTHPTPVTITRSTP
jgi:hypothetical protein